MLRDRHFRELLSSGGLALALKLCGLSAGYVFALIASRFYGPEAWGRFVVVSTVLGLTAIVAVLGMDMALLRLIAELRTSRDDAAITKLYVKALALSLAVALCLSLLVFQFATVIADSIYQKPELATSLRIASAGILPLAGISINARVLQAMKRIGEYAFVSLLARHLFSCIALGALWLFVRDGTDVVTAFVVSAWCVMFVSSLLVFKRCRFDGAFGAPVLSFRELFKISLPLLLASSIGFVKGWTDIIVLSFLVPESTVGTYSVALKLAAFASLPLFAVNTIAAPKFAELYARNDYGGLKKAVQHAARLSLLGSLPFCLLLVTMPAQLLSLFGEPYRVAAGPLVILVLGQLINASAGSVGCLLQMTGGQVFFQNVTVVVALLGIALNIALIPLLGILGAAISTAICLVSWNLACVAFAYRRHGFLTVALSWGS